MSELPRKLGLFSAVAVLVGSTIGSGIFRSPAGIAARIPDEPLFFLAWIIGGVCVLAGALTYAELASALPHTGGVFVYLKEGFGPLPAFLFGWAELTIVRASALGAIATVFAEYLLRMLGTGFSRDAVHYVAAASIILVAAFNIAGVSISALVQNMTASTKYLALLALVAVSFVFGSAPASGTAATGATNISTFGLALISILWVYDGWADVTFVSGEVKRPERYLALALIIGTSAVIAIYLLTNLAYAHVFSMTEISRSELVAADVASHLIGSAGVTLVSLAVMISAFGTLNGSMMTGPRIFFAMADAGLFFKKIAAVHPRFRTPHVAIGLAALLASIFVMFRNFEQLADTFVLGIWPFYAGGVAAVYSLRRKSPGLPRPYRVPGYPVTPAVFLAAAILLLANALLAERMALLVFGIIATGIPVFWIWHRGVRDV
jgi:APA family basic amino acid/polyamine antiporter